MDDTTGNALEKSITNNLLFAKNRYYCLVVLATAANFSGLFTTILEPDGALYASIAKHIAQKGDFINLVAEGTDWLDKPHFPFWLTAISFKIFGINTFAYKIVALLFWGIGAYYTYKLARLLYNSNVAKLSLLIYLTAAHLVISNNDVRAEPFLTGLIAGSVFHFTKACYGKGMIQVLAGAFFAALAVMTKGLFVLIIIGAGLLLHSILKKEWKQLFNFRWVIALALIMLFITPELYCLYAQFDLHPEKKIFGRYGVSGIRFFFWDSQFGRFFNNGPIKGSGNPFFYFHTILWAFLPWSLLLYASIARKLFYFKKNNAEYITLGTILATFLLFSLSSFQLPHYLNIIFPFLSIQVSQYLIAVKKANAVNTIKILQTIICVIMGMFLLALIYFFRPNAIVVSLLFVLLSGTTVIYYCRKNNLQSVVERTVATASVTYLFLNIFFYPNLLKYQSGSEAAFNPNKKKIVNPVIQYEAKSYSFDFYLDAKVEYRNKEWLKSLKQKGFITVFTEEKYIDSLKANNFSVKVLRRHAHFHISQLTGRFINSSSRQSELTYFVVAEIVPPEQSE
jgi:4-amino-4-deoxy-L-arabinose transferase-like glycosyltransferase